MARLTPLRPAFVLAASAVLGCVTEPDTAALDLRSDRPALVSSDSGRIDAEVMVEGPGLLRGQNVLHVRLIPLERGRTAELVSASGFMPSHGHSTDPAQIELTGDRYRLTNWVFYMAGRWDLTLDVELEEATDTIRFSVDVP